MSDDAEARLGGSEQLVRLLNEAADELAFMHRFLMEKKAMEEPIGSVERILAKIQEQTGHITDSPYPP